MKDENCNNYFRDTYGNMRYFLHMHTGDDVFGGSILSGYPSAGLWNRSHCEGSGAKEYGMPFLFGILSTVLGIVIMVVPGLKLMTDGMLIYIMAVWFLMQGVVGIVLSFRQKKLKGKGWIGTLILGVLGVLLGLYSLAHPLLLAFTFGVLVGMYFIECGVNMIVMASSIPSEG